MTDHVEPTTPQFAPRSLVVARFVVRQVYEDSQRPRRVLLALEPGDTFQTLWIDDDALRLGDVLHLVDDHGRTPTFRPPTPEPRTDRLWYWLAGALTGVAASAFVFIAT